MNAPNENDWQQTDKRLDALMAVLCTLHECEVITDPAISTERQKDGSKAVTVEFLLDYERVSGNTQEEQADENLARRADQ